MGRSSSICISAAPLQLEEQSAGGHIFELPGRVAPVPQAGQMLADPPTTPVAMIRQQRTDLRQLRRANETALNDARFKHGREYGGEKGRSPEQNEKILRPLNPPKKPSKITLDLINRRQLRCIQVKTT